MSLLWNPARSQNTWIWSFEDENSLKKTTKKNTPLSFSHWDLCRVKWSEIIEIDAVVWPGAVGFGWGASVCSFLSLSPHFIPSLYWWLSNNSIKCKKSIYVCTISHGLQSKILLHPSNTVRRAMNLLDCGYHIGVLSPFCLPCFFSPEEPKHELFN